MVADKCLYNACERVEADRLASIIEALPENVRSQVRIEWDRETHVEHGSTVTQMVAVALGLTAEQLDALFMSAAEL